jgi:hypothetical protein
MTKEKWLANLIKDKVVSVGDKKGVTAALLVAALLEVGPNKKRVSKWLALPISSFSVMWNRLVKSGVICGSKIHADFSDKKTSWIELCLLICVAQGYVKRAEAKP